MNSRTGVIGQTSRIPVRARRRLAKRQSLVGLAAYPRITFMQFDLVGSCIQGSGGKQLNFLRHLLCAFRHRLDNNGRETVRIISRGDRPGARQRVYLGDYVNVVWMKPKRVGYDLRCNGRVTLPIRATAQAQRDLPAGIDSDYGAGICTRLAVSSAALF